MRGVRLALGTEITVGHKIVGVYTLGQIAKFDDPFIVRYHRINDNGAILVSESKNTEVATRGHCYQINHTGQYAVEDSLVLPQFDDSDLPYGKGDHSRFDAPLRHDGFGNV